MKIEAMPKGRFETIPMPDEALDKARAYWTDRLAELQRSYERDAKPIMDELAKIEALRRHKHIFIAD